MKNLEYYTLHQLKKDLKRFWFWITRQEYCSHCNGVCTRNGSIYDDMYDEIDAL